MVGQLQLHAIPSAKVYILCSSSLHPPSHSSQEAPAQEPQQLSGDIAATHHQGWGPEAGVSRETFRAQLCQRLDIRLVFANSMQVLCKRGDMGEGVVPSPGMVVSP